MEIDSDKTMHTESQLASLRQRISELESIRTELEETRQSLVAEQTFSKSIIASLPGLFFMIDEKGLYHRWNKNLEKRLGYSAEEIMLRDCRDFVPPKDKNRVLEAVELGFREGSFTVKYDNLTRDGMPIPYFAQGVSVEIAGKRYVIGVELDLSELRLAEKALRENEEQLRALVESASNFAVYRLAFEEGDPTRTRIVFVSPSITDILGITDPMHLDGWFEAIPPDDAHLVRAYHSQLPRSKRTEQTIRVYHRGRGEWRWVQFLSTADYDQEGRLSHSNGIIFDVTDPVLAREELVRKEEELQRQADKLGRLNTALQVLVEHREKEMRDAEMNVLTALEKLVKPYLQNMAQSDLEGEPQTNLEIAVANLDKITSPLTRKLTSWQGLLSASEIRVADLIRNGKGTKEIAEMLGISVNTVSFHRKSIRRKLRLRNQDINLSAYLLSLDAG